MSEEILQVFKILEEEKANIRGKTKFEYLTLTQKQKIEVLDRVYQKILRRTVLKNE